MSTPSSNSPSFTRDRTSFNWGPIETHNLDRGDWSVENKWFTPVHKGHCDPCYDYFEHVKRHYRNNEKTLLEALADQRSSWFDRLMRHPKLHQRYAEMYPERVTQGLSEEEEEELRHQLDEATLKCEKLQEAQEDLRERVYVAREEASLLQEQLLQEHKSRLKAQVHATKIIVSLPMQPTSSWAPSRAAPPKGPAVAALSTSQHETPHSWADQMEIGDNFPTLPPSTWTKPEVPPKVSPPNYARPAAVLPRAPELSLSTAPGGSTQEPQNAKASGSGEGVYRRPYHTIFCESGLPLGLGRCGNQATDNWAQVMGQRETKPLSKYIGELAVKYWEVDHVLIHNKLKEIKRLGGRLGINQMEYLKHMEKVLPWKWLHNPNERPWGFEEEDVQLYARLLSSVGVEMARRGQQDLMRVLKGGQWPNDTQTTNAFALIFAMSAIGPGATLRT
ncbi:hypothetical protein FRC17_009541 [Serendipita sp. 399]|nr:hypothetical protein FRC17_009541 [Serendipita sp. 399]